MASKIFVNLPVEDLQRSIDFFSQLGFRFDPKFTDDTATCMIIGENIFAMLLTESRFRDFTDRDIADGHKVTEVLIAIDMESKEAVNEVVKKAISAGGSVYSDPMDHGWMYQHAFADLDGHQWEIMWMDESQMPEEMKQPAQ